MNKNFKTRFQEHKKDFICGERCSNFANHITEEGREMINMDDIMDRVNKNKQDEYLLTSKV